MVLLWTHCRRGAPGWPDEAGRAGWPWGTRERVASKKQKNSTTEATKLLKKWNGCGNEAKKYMETKELYENTGHEAKKWLKTNDITL